MGATNPATDGVLDLSPRIDTAGWSVPVRDSGDVSGEGSHLERYAQTLNAVEINSSFHRPHRTATYARWADATPDNFRFAVKLPKAMTHERRLEGCGELLDRFAAEVGGLGEKLAVLLVQLPPKAPLMRRIASGFFRDLRRRLPAQVVVEPRHPSWFAPGIDAWLTQRRIARVAADPARVPGAGEPGGWDGFVYYRWHGAPRMYYSAYDAAALEALRRRLKHSISHGIPAWCIFDNTTLGEAFSNARTLSARFATA